MITGFLKENKVIASSQEAFALYEKSQWGEKKQTHIEYTLLEMLSLINLKKAHVVSAQKEIPEALLLKKAKRHDKRAELKLAVLTDLRKKGHIVKTGLKFGTEFRVYKKGIKPGQDHAPWLLFPVKESELIHWYDFAAKNRVATSTNKHVLLAILDDSGDLSYYEINWIRP